MVTVTDLAWIAIALSAPICLLACCAVLAVSIVASAKTSVLERTVEMLTRRLVALQSRQTSIVTEPRKVTERIAMGPPLTDEPAPDPNGLVDPQEVLSGLRQAGDEDWVPKLDRRPGAV